MRLSQTINAALVLLIALPVVAVEIERKVDLRTGIVSPALPLEGIMEPVHQVRVVAEIDSAGAGKGTVEFDTNVPAYDEFGLPTKGEKAPRPATKAACTLKLIKATETNRLYELKIAKIATRLTWATGTGESYGERLLVHGKDGKVKQVVNVTDEAQERPLPPCHPGCFPAGTAVRVPGGVRPVESLRKGDPVLSVDADGNAAAVKVVDIFVTKNLLVQLRTADDILQTTPTQPLCLAGGGFRPAGEIRPGDHIWCWRDGARHKVEVLELTLTKRQLEVHNLVLGNSQIFIAGNFLARSKPPAETAAKTPHSAAQ